MSETSTKPYLLRAIYEWCTDNGYTPYLAVMADGRTRVPREFVKNGEIVLNVSLTATSGLKMGNDLIEFHARFGGVSREISVPVENVVAIYARENGQGMAFEVSSIPARDQAADQEATPHNPAWASVPAETGDGGEEPEPGGNGPRKGGRPTLTRIK